MGMLDQEAAAFMPLAGCFFIAVGYSIERIALLVWGLCLALYASHFQQGSLKHSFACARCSEERSCGCYDRYGIHWL
jgi:hypothetical protein